MEARPVEVSETAFIKFLHLNPSAQDRYDIRAVLNSLEYGEGEGTPVLFSYPQQSYLIVTGKWRIVCEDRRTIWYVTHIDDKL
jgi:hypothetical protein